MEHRSFLQYLYMIAIAVLTALTIGFGVFAGFSATRPVDPPYPTYPACNNGMSYPDQTIDSGCQKQMDDYNAAMAQFNERQMNRSEGRLAEAIVVAVVSFLVSVGGILLARKKDALIGDGILFGGIIALFYGAMIITTTGYSSDPDTAANLRPLAQFIILLAGLGLVITASVLRFGSTKKNS
jgi:hypothetical protein